MDPARTPADPPPPREIVIPSLVIEGDVTAAVNRHLAALPPHARAAVTAAIQRAITDAGR